MIPMRILIACECSGEVRRAFRALGHNAYSCDLKPAEDNSPFHIIATDDKHLLQIIRNGQWDMVIIHPPCTYLCVSGMHWTTRGLRDPKLTDDALQLVREIFKSNVPRIAVENPVSIISTRIRKPDQTIQPYMFGEDASKRTCLWLKGLPLLTGTKRIPGRKVEWPKGSGKFVERWANQTDSGQNKLGPSQQRAANRARTYPGIASAMADQWGKT